MYYLADLRKLKTKIDRFRLRRRVCGVLGRTDISFISQNCIGGRLYRLANKPYLSPTIGMWMRPSDFVEFSSDLELYLSKDVYFDAVATGEMGYPVGRVNNLKLMFEHYQSFDVAVEKWYQRRSRVDLRRVALILTDRDGATQEDFRRFDTLPYPKMLLTAIERPGVKCAVLVPRQRQLFVGELYGNWHQLQPALSRRVLQGLKPSGGTVTTGAREISP